MKKKSKKTKKLSTAEKRFHKLLDAWKKHIHDEIKLHRKMLTGKQTLKHHCEQSAKIHHEFIKRITKI